MNKLIPAPEKFELLSPEQFGYTAADAERVFDVNLPYEGYRLWADGDGLHTVTQREAA